jgi:hypothetical protein
VRRPSESRTIAAGGRSPLRSASGSASSAARSASPVAVPPSAVRPSSAASTGARSSLGGTTVCGPFEKPT